MELKTIQVAATKYTARGEETEKIRQWALVDGCYAVHPMIDAPKKRKNKRWVVTHVPTGGAIGPAVKRDYVMRYLNEKQETRSMNDKRQEFAYVGRKECGCVMAVRVDMGDVDTYQFLIDGVKSGLKFDHVAWDVYVNEVSNEPTFMKCDHGQLSLF